MELTEHQTFEKLAKQNRQCLRKNQLYHKKKIGRVLHVGTTLQNKILKVQKFDVKK